ncbi:MAG: right-handed parallel beta-helix repeat-containing protein [Actinomycetota bacterium]
MKKKLVLAATLSLIAGLLAITAAPAQAAPVVCGQVILASVTLANDVGPCPADGLVVGANNITINLNGHKVYGVPTPQATISYDVEVRANGQTLVDLEETGGVAYTATTGVGIRVGDPVTGASTSVSGGYTNVTIQGPGEITAFDAGVTLESGGSHTVTGVNIHDNFSDAQATAVLYGDGVAINGSSGNSITNNSITGNGPFSGVGMFGDADNNTVNGNTISDNARFADRSPLHHGAVGFTQETDGVRVEFFCDNNVVSNNTVTENGLDGIALFARTLNNIVSDNTVHDNGYDAPLAQGAPQRLGDGIRLFNGNAAGTVLGPKDTIVEDNSVFNNAANGIIVGNNSVNNDILMNATGSNGTSAADYDLNDQNPACDNNTWSGNTYDTANQACTTL